MFFQGQFGPAFQAQQLQRQQAYRQHQQQRREAQMRQHSANETARQLKAQHDAQQRRQLTAKTVRTHEPIPLDVWQQLEKFEGWLGTWLPVKYQSEAQLEHWREVWLTTSPVGQVILQRKIKEAEAVAAAKAQKEAQRLQQLKETAIRRERQELYRLPEGTKVRIHSPKSKMHGRVGTISACPYQWRGDRLWAFVAVEVLPPGHPMLDWPARNRPARCMPIVEQCPADQLERLHPEMF